MRIAIAGALLIPFIAVAQTAPSLSFDGCVDRQGRAVPATADPQQSAFVETRLADGGAELRYNPDALPQRKDLTRLFLFSQACARINLGIDPATASIDEARRADCWGLTSLLRSKLVEGDAQVAAIQGDLDLSADEWARLPGPPRSFALAACYREAIRLPADGPPSASQASLNACLHACGDRLYRCQGGALSSGGACMGEFERCEAGCGR